MNIIIRPVEAKDAKDLHEIRIMKGVRENILGIASEPRSKTEQFVQSAGSPGSHELVAEFNGKVVGSIGMQVAGSPRLSHGAGFGMMIHKDYQGKGIGSRLLEEMLDIADNWLMLKRVELTVFTDNERAIGLYQKFGFEFEGVKKFGAVRNGRYDDLYYMARYRNLPEEAYITSELSDNDSTNMNEQLQSNEIIEEWNNERD